MSALEEYQDYARHATVGHNYATIGGLRVRADAAIAELEGDVEYWKHHYKDCKASDYRNAMAAQKAEAENEKLRVCGTCGHHEAGECELGAFGMSGFDYCRYAESSWTPYWEDG